MSVCQECWELSDNLFLGLCEECWDLMNEKYGLGVQPIEKDKLFDDEGESK